MDNEQVNLGSILAGALGEDSAKTYAEKGAGRDEEDERHPRYLAKRTAHSVKRVVTAAKWHLYVVRFAGRDKERRFEEGSITLQELTRAIKAEERAKNLVKIVSEMTLDT